MRAGLVRGPPRTRKKKSGGTGSTRCSNVSARIPPPAGGAGSAVFTGLPAINEVFGGRQPHNSQNLVPDAFLCGGISSGIRFRRTRKKKMCFAVLVQNLGHAELQRGILWILHAPRVTLGIFKGPREILRNFTVFQRKLQVSLYSYDS